MSTPRTPPPARLVCSLFSKDEAVIMENIGALCGLFGPLSFQSLTIPFCETSYYTDEFGNGLKRVFIGFQNLIDQALLSEVKLKAVDLERRSMSDGKRLVNIDPGLLTSERLVLATGKNFSHRIYLGKGVFADLTLVCKDKKFRPLPWTYPDYMSEGILRLWDEAKRAYLLDLKAARAADSSASGPG
ncbi:MAG: DUF4416 family protein [Desulfobacteraceae bacterium]|nr:DUF4416 family protein [Desulfobacteraceae bacterium]